MSKTKAFSAHCAFWLLFAPQWGFADAASSPSPVPPAAYTLDQCLQMATQDPGWLLERHLVSNRAATAVSLARTQLGPQVSSVARANVTSSPIIDTYSADGTYFTGEKARAGLSVIYPLYDGGVRSARLKASKADLTAIEQQQQASQIQLLNDTTAAFYQVLQEQRLVESSRLQHEEATAHQVDAEARFALGTVTKGDVLSAQSAVAAAQSEDERRNAQLIAARAHLAVLIGLDPARTLPTVVAPDIAPGLNAPSDALIAIALQASPERAQLQAEQNAASWQLAAIKAGRSPTVSLQAGTGYVDRQDPNNTSHQIDQPYALVSLELNVPLFERASQQAREKDQQDTLQLRALAVHDYEQSLKEQIIASSAAYRATLAETEAMSQSVSSAEEAYRLAQERYAVGKGTQTDVLASLTRLTLARDSQADTLNQRDMAAQRLLRFAGNEKYSLAAFTPPAEPALPEPAIVPLVPVKTSAPVPREATVIPATPVALIVAPQPKPIHSATIVQPPTVAHTNVQAPVTAAVMTPPVPLVTAPAPTLSTLTATSAPTHVPLVGFVLVKTPLVTKVAGSQEERRSPSHSPGKDKSQNSSPGSTSIKQTPKP